MNLDEQRQRVLDAAEQLFYGRGIQSVGMDEIRAAAGVSLKRIYQLYPSKDELVADVLRIRDQRWVTGLKRHVDAAATPVDKVLAVFDWLAEWFSQPDFRGCSFINSFGELGAVSSTVADAARANKSTYQRQIAALVRAANLPAALATHIALLTEGAITTAAISGNAQPARHARDAATILVMQAEATRHSRRQRVPGA